MTAQETSQLAQELYKELVGNAAADVWDWQLIANKAFTAAENFAIVAQKRGPSIPPAPFQEPAPEPIPYIPPPGDQLAAAQSQSQMMDPTFPRTYAQADLPGPVAAAAVYRTVRLN